MSTNISIKDLKEKMARRDVSPKQRANDRKEAQKFLDDPSVKIVEKIDGTKLTLLRRNNPFDPNDYSKNWYISYKGNIIYPGETRRLASLEDDIRKHSSGTAQYSLVHSHMARVHSGTRDIPPGTEFFLEFVQRKPTISRDYPQKHGIFLTFYGPSRYKVTGLNLVTNITPEEGQPRLEEYARILQVNMYPVLFEGSLATLAGLRDGIRSRMIQNRYVKTFNELRAAYEDKTEDRPIKIVEAIYNVFYDFQTTLSTDADVDEEGKYPPAEGSVFATSATKALYKALRFDQHDEKHRQDVKRKYKADTPEEEKTYWDGITSIAQEIASKQAMSQRRNIPESEIDQVLENIHHECYFNSTIVNRLMSMSLRHPKSLIQRQEDLFLTTKSRVMRRLEVGDQNGINIGIFVVSGKPIHDGHWQMIKRVAEGSDEALIITSTSGRDELQPGVMIDAWKEVLEPQFHRDYPKATLIITSESPLDIAVQKMRDLKDIVNSFVFYSDDEDARVKYNPKKIEEMMKDPVAFSKFQSMPIPRSETVNISGTKMREFLNRDDRESFDHYAPRTLSPEMKGKYWSILKGTYGDIKDSRVRNILKMILEIKNS